MVAGFKSIKECSDIIISHIGKQSALNLMTKLIKVEGNKSFKETIKLIYYSVLQSNKKESNNEN
jgi:hypothetical protein